MEQDKIKELISFQVRRKIIDLVKHFLFILEDSLNENYNKEDFQHHRKRILDFSNDAIRELEETFKSLDITIKKDKL